MEERLVLSAGLWDRNNTPRKITPRKIPERIENMFSIDQEIVFKLSEKFPESAVADSTKNNEDPKQQLPESMANAEFAAKFENGPAVECIQSSSIEKKNIDDTPLPLDYLTRLADPLDFKFESKSTELVTHGHGRKSEYAPYIYYNEEEYLDLVADILDVGSKRGDRTGTGTISIFGAHMQFNLRNGEFPLLTTKKMPFRWIVEELLWFISGKTDARILSKKGINIWDKDTSRETLDKRGLKHFEEGDAGKNYSFQFRHWGAKYEGMNKDYKGQGIDQLKNVIDLIKNDPNSRRIILSAWNPEDLDQVALPPCHCMCQFYVNNGELSCQLYQRSGDIGLGVPFNIASYSLLTCMLADICGLKPGDFIHVIGDSHIYLNHVEKLKEQIERKPRDPPKLKINHKNSIDDFVFEDFTLENYNPHPAIDLSLST